MNSLTYVVLAVGIVMWAALIYVIVVEPIRVYVRERQRLQIKPARVPRLKALSRP